MARVAKPKEPVIALIDGDTLIYEACLATERETEWADDIWTLHGDLNEAREHFEGAIIEMQDQLGADQMVLVLSDATRNWRKTVMESYKANRKKKRKPVTYHPLRSFCHEQFDTFERPWLEGDDVLGVLATHPTLMPGHKILVSVDKDMKGIPGHLLNYRHARDSGDWSGCVVTQEEADRWHLKQTLMGDQVDNYPGCPGFGEVTAEKWFATHGATWASVVAAYATKGLSEEVALMNARVARITRADDYDFKTKEVILWSPTSD